MARHDKPQRPLAAAAVFSALGDETRLTLLTALEDGPKPVHALAALFAISRPAISRHLRVLKETGLVREVKTGRENLYMRVETGLAAARDWFGAANVPSPVVAPMVETAPAKPGRRKAAVAPVVPEAAKPPAAPLPKPQLSLFD